MEAETESRKVFQGQSDYESGSDSGNAPIDLLPPEMLQSIYGFLPFKDLLVCREVNKKWKRVATDSVRKRCAPVDFSRDDIPKSQRSRALQSFNQLIRATDQQGDFPVTEFQLDMNSDYYWMEMDGSTLICQFLKAVSHFVRHVNFHFNENKCFLPNNCPAIPQDLTFPNLTKITLEVYEEKNKHRVIFSFIRDVIEKSPNVKELHPHLHNIRRNGAIRRCIVETGIEQKASLITSLIMTAPKRESDFEDLNKLGLKLKLKDFRVNLTQHNGNTEIFKAFLKSQSDTLTFLQLLFVKSYQYFMELPRLPHLKNLKISYSAKQGEEQFPTLFYKNLLPALKTLDLAEEEFATGYFMASHMAPSESLRELILPKKDIKDAGGVIRQAARLFPNLKKLEVSHRSARPYMSYIYEELPGIEELCITTDGRVNLDNFITGLPERVLSKIEYDGFEQQRPSYPLSKALAMLERGTTKSLACLENLKVVMIYKGREYIAYANQGDDFTELSGVVFKQMKSLQRIDFGIRKNGPIMSASLKEDLEAHGIKLLYQRHRYVRARTDFIVSLTEFDDSNSYDPGSGPDQSDSHSDSD